MMGEQIERRRKELGLTMQELADKVGVTPSTINKWEKGNIKNIKRDTIAKLATALDVSPILLMDFGERNRLDYEFHKGMDKLIIEGYRKADALEQEMVRRILHISNEMIHDNIMEYFNQPGDLMGRPLKEEKEDKE